MNRKCDLSEFIDQDVIFTSLFRSKRNPQTGTHVVSDGLGYILPWVMSVSFLKLNAVIIHDGLEQDVIDKHASSTLKFYYYNPVRYSLNDERFFALNEIFESFRFKKVLLTDGADLFIKKSPFDFFDSADKMYFGSDEEAMPRVCDNHWCVEKFKAMIACRPQLFEDVREFLRFEYVNAGVYGGFYQIVKEFTKGFTEFMGLLDNEDNNNMMALNYLLWRFEIPFFSGSPLTSNFKRYDFSGDYFIIHK